MPLRRMIPCHCLSQKDEQRRTQTDQDSERLIGSRPEGSEGNCGEEDAPGEKKCREAGELPL